MKRFFIFLSAMVFFLAACGVSPRDSQEPGNGKGSRERGKAEKSASRTGSQRPEARRLRAVSLRSLERRAEACRRGSSPASCPEDVIRLGGLKRVEGYVVDPKNRDLVIFGDSSGEGPGLYSEDLAVAIRYAWLQYGDFEGNVYRYSHPGCSIDPDPATVARLQRVAARIAEARGREAVRGELDAWSKVCREPQRVRVMGVPPDSRFASVMVEADYQLKALADGTEQAAADLPGVLERYARAARTAAVENRSFRYSAGIFNRFWFHPGKAAFREDGDIVLLDRCDVQLQTEQSYPDAEGRLASGRRADPFAEAFAREFTRGFDELARERPVFRELESLFRLTALAKSMKYRSAPAAAGMEGFPLDGFPVGREPVPRTLPGRFALEEFEHRVKREDHTRVLRMWFPSCGGVSIDYELGESDFRRARGDRLETLKRLALQSRPGGGALYWDIRKRL